MLLKYNLSNIIREKRKINDFIYNKDTGIVTTTLPHMIEIGESILLKRIIDDKGVYSKQLPIINDNFSDKTFSFSYQTINDLYVKDVVDAVINNEDVSMFKVKGDIPSILKINDELSLQKRLYRYQFIRDKVDEDNFNEVYSNPSNEKNNGYDTLIYDGKVYRWVDYRDEIDCTYIGGTHFYCQKGKVNMGEILEINDETFMKDNDIIEGVEIYEYMESIKISVPLDSTISDELNDEDIIQNYFDEKKDELVPDIIDYEKKCFTPYYMKKVNNDVTVFEQLSQITFNLFLRDRSGSDEWGTNDSKGWNQYLINNSGNFVKKEGELTKGDLVSVLGFTDDDIYYRKQKVSKSFLRLSFYDGNNPLTHKLLFYSTIFMDDGELFGKYIKNLSKKTDKEIVSMEEFGDDNLTISFNVNDRYNRTKSSEGFYLYLFPDFDNGKTERTIYMKAEFNHPGYGKTIPFICANDGSKQIDFNDIKFPTSFIDEDNFKLETYFNNLYIPLTIAYNEELNNYIYYFKYSDKYDTKITINLYEPKINPLN